MKTKVLLSIKPEYANKIFSGEKKFEFRKTLFKKKSVKTVIVYATMPVGKIIGEFKIKKIHKDKPEKIWELTKENSGIDKNYFEKYYDGKKYAIAIEVESAKLYDTPIDPKEKFKKFTPPQSFTYIKDLPIRM